MAQPPVSALPKPDYLDAARFHQLVGTPADFQGRTGFRTAIKFALEPEALNACFGGMHRSALKPMLATLIETPFDDREWVFETKWDGFRLVAETGGANGSLYSRNGNDVTKRYASVAKALQAIKRSAVIDGELVALDGEGRSRFQLLQNALKGGARLRYYAFDLLFLDGADLRGKPLTERKDPFAWHSWPAPAHPLLRA